MSNEIRTLSAVGDLISKKVAQKFIFVLIPAAFCLKADYDDHKPIQINVISWRYERYQQISNRARDWLSR